MILYKFVRKNMSYKMNFMRILWTEEKYNGFKLSTGANVEKKWSSGAHVEWRSLYLYASPLNSRLTKRHKTKSAIKMKRDFEEKNQM